MLDSRISAGNTLYLARFIRAGQWLEAEKWLRRAADQAAGIGCNRVLLSSEWLLEALSGDAGLIELNRRLEAMGAASIEFMLVLRDPVGQFISLYKHRAKRGTTGSIDAWAENGYDLPFRLAALRQQVEVGNVKLAVRGYGKEPGSLERLFFSDWLGVPVPERAADLRVNPSLRLSELVLLRQLSTRNPGLVPYLYERLLEIPLNQKLEGHEMLEHARQVAIQAVARYADEWARWNDLLPTNERFDIQRSGPEPGAEPIALELSAEQLATVMQLLSDALGYRLRLQVLWTSRLRPLLARVKQLFLPGFSRR